MPGTFAYTESTNTVVVTGGTSGSPADFASFVTADRAGTATDLLTAAAPGSSVTLTYQVRPVELLAIPVKFIVASKTTETDYLFITGTDAWGAAQTESIDVSAGNGSYTSTKRWATITDIDCSDNSAGGGTVWADGTIAVTQDIWGVVENPTTKVYIINCNVTFGDGSTSTYFRSSDGEFVLFADEKLPQTTTAATLQLGKLLDGYGESGVYWSVGFLTNATTYWFSVDSSIVLIYGSYITDRGTADHAFRFGGTTTIVSSHLEGSGYASVGSAYQFAAVGLTDVYFSYCQGLRLTVTPSPCVNVWVHDCSTKLYVMSNPVTATGVRLTTDSWVDVQTWNALDPGIILINPINIPDGWNLIGGGTSYVKYTCDIHIADKDGNNLSGATVLCEDVNSDEVFSVDTDVNGDIAQQNITYETYSGSDYPSTQTLFTPHKFTVSKAGYHTLTLEAITVDDKIAWHLELQPLDEPPAPWEA